MKSQWNKAVIWIGWAISLIFIVWAVMKMDLNKIVQAIAQADYRWIIIAGLTTFLILFFRGARWRHFIEPIKPITVMSSFSAMCIGFMANMILPARLGEITRAYVIARREDISKGSAFGTVVMERAIDGLSIVILMLILFMLIEPPVEGGEFFYTLKAAGITTSIFFVLFFIGLVLFHKKVRAVVWLIDIIASFLPQQYGEKFKDILGSFCDGFDSLSDPPRLMKIALWSVIVWGAGGLFNYFIFQAFDLQLPFIACFVVMLSQVFGVLAPSAPGFIGVYHAATIAGLMFYGVDSDQAFSVAFVTHAVLFTVQTVAGLIFLWMEQYSLHELQEEAETEAS